MNATLKLNLTDSLNIEELTQLVELAREQGKSLERVLYEAAKEMAAKIRSQKAQGKEAA